MSRKLYPLTLVLTRAELGLLYEAATSNLVTSAKLSVKIRNAILAALMRDSDVTTNISD